MDVFVFSDERGIFDYKSHEYFVYAGIIIIGKQEMDSPLDDIQQWRRIYGRNPNTGICQSLRLHFLMRKTGRNF